MKYQKSIEACSEHRFVPLFFVGNKQVSLILVFCIAWTEDYIEGLGLCLGVVGINLKVDPNSGNIME
jgi:hypothetical protein